MSKANEKKVDLNQARTFLETHLAVSSIDVELVGEGAWSRCFGFRQGSDEFVIRFGNHVDDFQKDQFAHTFHRSGLPIPKVLEIGQTHDSYYAISTRAHGVPLESLNTSQWITVVPSLVAVLESLRTANLSSTEGFGGWNAAGKASQTHWSGHLLSVGEDPTTQRTHGWRKRLTVSAIGEAAFLWGFDLLKQVVNDSIPRSLVHCDLINKNVLVNKEQISGVFDWGCSLFGDHLYDLAWFEFWAPWYPALNIPFLRSELERRWDEIGYVPEAKESRLMTCYLHIGLDHLAYNAYLGDWATLAATAERMRTLVERV